MYRFRTAAFSHRVALSEGVGVVLAIDATPEMIVSSPDMAGWAARGEAEYLVDPRLIQPVLRVIE